MTELYRDTYISCTETGIDVPAFTQVLADWAGPDVVKEAGPGPFS